MGQDGHQPRGASLGTWQIRSQSSGCRTQHTTPMIGRGRSAPLFEVLHALCIPIDKCLELHSRQRMHPLRLQSVRSPQQRPEVTVYGGCRQGHVVLMWTASLPTSLRLPLDCSTTPEQRRSRQWWTGHDMSSMPHLPTQIHQPPTVHSQRGCARFYSSKSTVTSSMLLQTLVRIPTGAGQP
jgi:hypothetical protein